MGTDEYIKVQLILFLNKCDILERKLARGVSLKRHIPSYGDRKNDLPTASKCVFVSFSTSRVFSFFLLSSMRHKALKIFFFFSDVGTQISAINLWKSPVNNHQNHVPSTAL